MSVVWNFLKPTKFLLGYFLIFSILGFGWLFLRGEGSPFAVSYSLPETGKYCYTDGAYELYYPQQTNLSWTPFFGYFYGKICNKTILYLLNIPYYYFWAVIFSNLMKKMMASK